MKTDSGMGRAVRARRAAPAPVAGKAAPPAAPSSSKASKARTASSAPSAPKVRRTQAERSEATRIRLIEATAKLLRTRGYGGLRTAEISDVAGVSRGAQLHHFPTKNDLVIATARHLNDVMLERSRERALAARSSADPIAELIADACDFFFGDYFFIPLAVGMSDERNKELKKGVMPYMVPSRLAVERQWIDVLEASGLPHALAVDVVTLTLSMVRGFGVRTLLVDPKDRFAPQLALWREIIGEHIAARLRSGRAPDKRSRSPR